MIQAKSSSNVLKVLVPNLSRKARLLLLGALLSGLLATVLGVIQPRIISKLIDNVAIGSPIDSYLVQLACLVLSVIILQSLQAYATEKAAAESTRQFRQQVGESLLRTQVSEFDSMTKGDLIARATTDISKVKDLTSSGLVSYVTAAVNILVVTVAMVVLDWRLSFVTALIVAAGALIVLLFGKSFRTLSNSVQQQTGRYAQSIEMIVAGIRHIKANRAEKAQRKALAIVVDDCYSTDIKLARTAALVQPLMNTLVYGGVIAVIIVGIFQIQVGALTTGSFLGFLLYLFMLITPISTLNQSYITLQVGVGAWDRIKELRNLKFEDEIGASSCSVIPDGGVHANKTTVLKFDSVSFSYHPDSSNLVLKDLSFSVARGEIVGLVGSTGAGKSTILDLIEKFYDVQRGTIYINGQNIASISHRQARAHISVIDQDTSALTASVRDNLLTDNADITPEYQQQVLEMVGLRGVDADANLELDQTLGQDGQLLSGGQRQRLAWARVLLDPRELVLLDEPTSHLDQKTSQKLMKILKNLKQHHAILISTHSLDVMRQCDRILLLREGAILRAGRYDELSEELTSIRDYVRTESA